MPRAFDLASPSLSLALEGYACSPTPAKARVLPRTRVDVGFGAHIKLMQEVCDVTGYGRFLALCIVTAPMNTVSMRIKNPVASCEVIIASAP